MSYYYKLQEKKADIEKKIEDIKKKIRVFENTVGIPFEDIQELFATYGVKTKEEFLLKAGMTEKDFEEYIKQNEEDLYQYKELWKGLKIYQNDLEDILDEIYEIEDKIKEDVETYFEDLSELLEEQSFISNVEWNSQIPVGSAYLNIETDNDFFVIRFSDHSSYEEHGGFKGYTDFGEPTYYEKADFEFLFEYDVNILKNMPNKMIVLDAILKLIDSK